MRRFAVAFSILLVLLSTSSAQTDQAWIRLAPENTGFAVMLPAKPEEQVNTKENFSSRLFTLLTKDGATPRAIYLMGWGEYGASVKVDTQRELEANRDNFIKEIPGMRHLGTQKISLDGRPGIEFTADSNQASVVSRVYVVGNRVFQLAVMVFKGIDEKSNVNKFFDSFAFTTAN